MAQYKVNVLKCRTKPNHPGLQKLNKPCVFPFRYQGTTYYECITKDNGDIPWCATKVRSDLRYIRREWGICGPQCHMSNFFIYLTISSSRFVSPTVPVHHLNHNFYRPVCLPSFRTYSQGQKSSYDCTFPYEMTFFQVAVAESKSAATPLSFKIQFKHD